MKTIFLLIILTTSFIYSSDSTKTKNDIEQEQLTIKSVTDACYSINKWLFAYLMVYSQSQNVEPQIQGIQYFLKLDFDISIKTTEIMEHYNRIKSNDLGHDDIKGLKALNLKYLRSFSEKIYDKQQRKRLLSLFIGVAVIDNMNTFKISRGEMDFLLELSNSLQINKDDFTKIISSTKVKFNNS
jgi:hypothetical protein